MHLQSRYSLSGRAGGKGAALVLSVLLLLSLPVAGQNDPDLYAYDGFDYEVDTTLEYQGGGFGWSGVWDFRPIIDGKWRGVAYNSAILQPGSLTYGDLTTTGNHVHLYGDYGKLELARRLAEVIPGNDGDTTYISFIGQRIGPPVDPNTPDPHWDNPDTPEVEPYPYPDNLYPQGAAPVRIWNTIGRESLSIGNFVRQPQNTWMLYGGGLLHPSDKSYTEAPAFIVVRINHHGNDDPADQDNATADDIFLWVNPPIGQPENPELADVVAIAARDVHDETNPVDFSDLLFVSPFADYPDGDYPHSELLLDEFRIGRTWASVTPTGNAPQPTRIIGVSGGAEFGQVQVGQSQTAAITLSNSGDSNLTISGIAFPDGFSGDWSESVIAAGGNRELVVTFSPSAPGEFGGTVTISSDATAGDGSFAVSGTGVSVSRVISLAGDLNYGDVVLGTSAERTLTISNSGNAGLMVNSITYPEGFTGDWTGGLIAVDGQQEVVVTFTPVAAQAYAGSVVIDSDATNGSAMIAVSGTGVEDNVPVDEWAGIPFDENGDCSTGRFLNWINVTTRPWVWSYAFQTWIYMPEAFVTSSGSWGYAVDAGSEPRDPGQTTPHWVGFSMTVGGDVNTGHFLGWLNSQQAPMHYSYGLVSWIYAPGNQIGAEGGWVYFYDFNAE